jgi:hypothetical protein
MVRRGIPISYAPVRGGTRSKCVGNDVPGTLFRNEERIPNYLGHYHCVVGSIHSFALFFLVIFLSHGQNQILTVKIKSNPILLHRSFSFMYSLSTGPREVWRAARLAAWRLAPWPRIFDSATPPPPLAPPLPEWRGGFRGWGREGSG